MTKTQSNAITDPCGDVSFCYEGLPIVVTTSEEAEHARFLAYANGARTRPKTPLSAAGFAKAIADVTVPRHQPVAAYRKRNIMYGIIEADFLPPAVAKTKEKPRILMIDDNRDFTHSGKLALERTGRYSVWEENEPARAHLTAQRVKPDLVLLDIAMPETDGGEVAARIESDPTLHRTPVIFLTGLVTKAETRSGLQIQGHQFLAKPISIPELVAGIEQNLPAHAASRR
jgi:CheY-like chemotaxis protein